MRKIHFLKEKIIVQTDAKAVCLSGNFFKLKNFYSIRSRNTSHKEKMFLGYFSYLLPYMCAELVHDVEWVDSSFSERIE